MHKVRVVRSVRDAARQGVLMARKCRCPMEVNMINSAGLWSCQITLRVEFGESGARLPEVIRIPFGVPLTSLEDVELALWRAQAAILNYHQESTDLFLTKARDELEYYRSHEALKKGTLKFTKNVIVVDIFDPTCANLSFVDLPGKSITCRRVTFC